MVAPQPSQYVPTAQRPCKSLAHSGMSLRAEGVKAEALYAKDKTLPDPTSTDNPEYQIVLSIIKEVRNDAKAAGFVYRR